ADRSHVDKFKRRFAGKSEVIDVVAVNVLDLLVYQFIIVTDRATDYAQSTGRWSRKTLVIDRPNAQLPSRVEGGVIKLVLPHAEHAFNFNPNGITIQQSLGYVSVSEVQGRAFLQAGYHRSFAFARAVMNSPDAIDRLILVALTRTLPFQLAPA